MKLINDKNLSKAIFLSFSKLYGKVGHASSSAGF
jgi:hypothetical protein